MANSSPATSTTSVKTFWTEVVSRYTQLSPMISTPTTMLAATGVAYQQAASAMNFPVRHRLARY